MPDLLQNQLVLRAIGQIPEDPDPFEHRIDVPTAPEDEDHEPAMYGTAKSAIAMAPIWGMEPQEALEIMFRDLGKPDPSENVGPSVVEQMMREANKDKAVTIPSEAGPASFGSTEAALALAPIWGVTPQQAFLIMLNQTKPNEIDDYAEAMESYSKKKEP